MWPFLKVSFESVYMNVSVYVRGREREREREREGGGGRGREGGRETLMLVGLIAQ